MRARRDLAARSHSFVYRPADPERFYDMLLLLANGAAQDRQWQTAYRIASQLDDVLPQGALVSEQPIECATSTPAWLSWPAASRWTA